MKKVTLCILILALICTGCTKKRMVDGNAEIDWVDFIKVNGISYVADYHQSEHEMDISEVGKVYAKVKYNVSDNVHNPSYETQDGDAAFLEVGTKIYKLKNYNPDSRLGVIVNEKIKIYDADYNPDAKKGEDLLDIREKVKYIDVVMEDEKGTSETYIIDEMTTINKLVNYILDADVSYDTKFSGGDQYFLDFCLIDNTRIKKCYFINDNYLNPGIILADEFRDEFSNSIEKK